MLQELIGRTVEVHLKGYEGTKLKGKALRIDDAWLELATKKRVEFINISAIKRIFATS